MSTISDSDTDSSSGSDIDPSRDAISSKPPVNNIPEVPIVNVDPTNDAMKLKEARLPYCGLKNSTDSAH